MTKKLKIWNGRGYCCYKPNDPKWSALNGKHNAHAYVAAYSRADARRVIHEYCGFMPPDSEIRDYWSEGAWGKSMEGVIPERGLWIQFDRHNSKPERVL